MTKSEMYMLWLYVQETWPQFSIPEGKELLSVKELTWSDQLSDLDANLIRAAIVSLGKRDFPPTPGLIREAALNLEAGEMGIGHAPDIDQAWDEFKTRYRNNGPWSHEAIAQAARAIGCSAFGTSPADEVMAWRAQFVKMYVTVVTRLDRMSKTPAPILAQRMEALNGPKRLDPMSAIGGGQ